MKLYTLIFLLLPSIIHARRYPLAFFGRKQAAPEPVPAPPVPEEKPLGYADLTPLGKLVAGSIEVGVSTVMEYTSGFMGGYFIGVITDVPRLLTKTVEAETLKAETLGRLARLHVKSFTWAKTWGGVSAVFGGFRVATKVARNGIEDEWNNVISSMAAGAYFTRKDGPQGMIKGAALYGGLTYLLSGGLTLRKQPFEYEEKEVEF